MAISTIRLGIQPAHSDNTLKTIAVFRRMNRGTSVSLVDVTAKMAVPPAHVYANSYKRSDDPSDGQTRYRSTSDYS
jgi:hypothetical protein